MRSEILQQAKDSVREVMTDSAMDGFGGVFTLEAGETLTFPETDTQYFELQVRRGAQVISSSFYLEQPGQVPERGANYIEADFNKSSFESRFRERVLAAGALLPVRDGE